MEIQLILNKEDEVLISEALSQSGIEKDDFYRTAIVSYAKNILGKREQSSQNNKDWSEVPSEKLKGSKARSAIEERIYRSFQAIANYNDNAPSNNERWYIGNVVLRQLSGSNGQVVGDWIRRHQTLIDDHNNKYSLGQYHNKGRGDVTSVISW